MKALGALLLALLFLAAPPCLQPLTAGEGKSSSEFHEIEGSGVRGDVMLVSLPAGGTLAVVNLVGLAPGAPYYLVRAAGGSCDIESYDDSDAIADMTANSSGRATATLELEQDREELGTFSVWTPENELVACASVVQ